MAPQELTRLYGHVCCALCWWCACMRRWHSVLQQLRQLHQMQQTAQEGVMPPTLGAEPGGTAHLTPATFNKQTTPGMAVVFMLACRKESFPSPSAQGLALYILHPPCLTNPACLLFPLSFRLACRKESFPSPSAQGLALYILHPPCLIINPTPALSDKSCMPVISVVISACLQEGVLPLTFSAGPGTVHPTPALSNNQSYTRLV
jgi:hypothetical protein